MVSSFKLVVSLLFAGTTYGAYYGGIIVGPFQDPTTDSVFCPPGTEVGLDVVWCCPTGTTFVNTDDAGALCCPTSANCETDLLNSGVQCADPSMTLWKRGGSLICCPEGYYLNDERICANTGSPSMYTSTAQAAHLTMDGSSPTSTGSPSSPASQTAIPTASPTDSGSSAPSNSAPASKTPAPSGTATGSGGATVKSTSSAAAATAASLDKGLGGLLALVGMLMV